MKKIKRFNRWRKEHPTEVWMILACGATVLCFKQQSQMDKLAKEVKYWRGYERTLYKAIQEGAKITIKHDLFTGEDYIDIVS